MYDVDENDPTNPDHYDEAIICAEMCNRLGISTLSDAISWIHRLYEDGVFPTEDGARSVGDLGLPVLVVSQFTLYADTRKGRRPSWDAAAPGEVAEPLVEGVVAELRRRGSEVATGVFGARMLVSSVNEGPMTLLLEV